MTPEYAASRLGWCPSGRSAEQRREEHAVLVAHGVPSIALVLADVERCSRAEAMDEAELVIRDVCAMHGIEGLLTEVGRADWAARAVVASTLGREELPDADARFAALELLVTDPDATVRDEAFNSLMRFGERALDVLRKAASVETTDWLRAYMLEEIEGFVCE